MHGLYDYLNQKYGSSTEIRLFFTTEPFPNRKGCHNYFVVYIADKKLHQQIITDVQDYFNYDRTDVSIYDRYQAGLFYRSKDGLEKIGILSATAQILQVMRIKLKTFSDQTGIEVKTAQTANQFKKGKFYR